MDASQAQTDVESFAALEPVADGFRNYLRAGCGASAEALLVDKAQLLTLSAPGQPPRSPPMAARGSGGGGGDFFIAGKLSGSLAASIG